MQKVLFVCRHNSARSVMAEAFTNALSDGLCKAESAGLDPGTLNPLVVNAMHEVGLDVSGHVPCSAFDLFKEGRLYTHVITVCDPEFDSRCPFFPGVAHRTHWPFPNPSAVEGIQAAKLEQVRVIRDEIKRKVKDFIATGCR